MNGTHTLIYKNGVLRDFDDISGYGITMGNGVAPVILGGMSHGGYFYGSMDELRIFNRSLNSSEIIDLYNLNLSLILDILDVNIISPENITYNISNYSINITLDKAGYCEYSLDGGVSNNSLVSNLSNGGFTTIKNNIADGNYILNVYCNNSLGVKNYTEKVFFSINTSNISAIITEEQFDNNVVSSSGGSSGGGGGSTISNDDEIEINNTPIENSPPKNEEPSNFQENQENTNQENENSNLVGLAINENLQRGKINISLILIVSIFVAAVIIIAYRKFRLLLIYNCRILHP